MGNTTDIRVQTFDAFYTDAAMETNVWTKAHHVMQHDAKGRPPIFKLCDIVDTPRRLRCAGHGKTRGERGRIKRAIKAAIKRAAKREGYDMSQFTLFDTTSGDWAMIDAVHTTDATRLPMPFNVGEQV